MPNDQDNRIEVVVSGQTPTNNDNEQKQWNLNPFLVGGVAGGLMAGTGTILHNFGGNIYNGAVGMSSLLNTPIAQSEWSATSTIGALTAITALAATGVTWAFNNASQPTNDIENTTENEWSINKAITGAGIGAGIGTIISLPFGVWPAPIVGGALGGAFKGAKSFPMKKALATGTILATTFLPWVIDYAHSPHSIKEHKEIGHEVTTLKSDIPGANYKITDGNTEDVFEINQETGALTVKNSDKLDYENENTRLFNLKIESSDGHKTEDHEVNIVVKNDISDDNQTPQSTSNTTPSASNSTATAPNNTTGANTSQHFNQNSDNSTTPAAQPPATANNAPESEEKPNLHFLPD